MTLQIRAAVKADAQEIARLFRMSADGYADYTWAEYTKMGEELLAVGAARFSREDTEFSYQNCIVAQEAGVVIGLLHSYPVYAVTETNAQAQDQDPVFSPFVNMQVSNALYIPGIAVDEQWRGKGVGSLLLEKAWERAKMFNLSALSLICFSSNQEALRLYVRQGFSVVKETLIVPHPLITASGAALLMVANQAS